MSKITTILTCCLFFGLAHAQDPEVVQTKQLPVGKDSVLVFFERNYWTEGSKDTTFTDGLGAQFHGKPILITGSAQYPLPLVLNNLGLEAWVSKAPPSILKATNSSYIETSCACVKTGCQCVDLDEGWEAPASAEGLKVLSIGEGYSPLLPSLLSQGAKAYAADLAYFRKPDPKFIENEYENTEALRALQAYETIYHSSLIQADATQLKKNLPSEVQAEGFDMIVAHRLVNNLDDEDTVKVLHEAYRLLKPGATLRISHFPESLLTDRKAFGRVFAPMGKVAPFHYIVRMNRVEGSYDEERVTALFDEFELCEKENLEIEDPEKRFPHEKLLCRGPILHQIYPEFPAQTLFGFGEFYYMKTFEMLINDRFIERMDDTNLLLVVRRDS